MKFGQVTCGPEFSAKWIPASVSSAYPFRGSNLPMLGVFFARERLVIMEKYVIPTEDQIRASLAHNCNEHGEECDLPCISCGQIIGADGYCDDVNCPNYKNGLIAGYLNENCACEVMGWGKEHSPDCSQAH